MVGKIIEQIRKKQVVEEEETILNEEQEIEIGKNYSLLQQKASQLDSVINSDLNSIGGRSKLKRELKDFLEGETGALPLLKQRTPNITIEETIDRLIKLSSKKGTSNYNPKLIKALSVYKKLI